MEKDTIFRTAGAAFFIAEASFGSISTPQKPPEINRYSNSDHTLVIDATPYTNLQVAGLRIPNIEAGRQPGSEPFKSYSREIGTAKDFDITQENQIQAYLNPQLDGGSLRGKIDATSGREEIYKAVQRVCDFVKSQSSNPDRLVPGLFASVISSKDNEVNEGDPVAMTGYCAQVNEKGQVSDAYIYGFTPAKYTSIPVIQHISVNPDNYLILMAPFKYTDKSKGYSYVPVVFDKRDNQMIIVPDLYEKPTKVIPTQVPMPDTHSPTIYVIDASIDAGQIKIEESKPVAIPQTIEERNKSIIENHPKITSEVILPGRFEGTTKVKGVKVDILKGQEALIKYGNYVDIARTVLALTGYPATNEKPVGLGNMYLQEDNIARLYPILDTPNVNLLNLADRIADYKGDLHVWIPNQGKDFRNIYNDPRRKNNVEWVKIDPRKVNIIYEYDRNFYAGVSLQPDHSDGYRGIRFIAETNTVHIKLNFPKAERLKIIPPNAMFAEVVAIANGEFYNQDNNFIVPNKIMSSSTSRELQELWQKIYLDAFGDKFTLPNMLSYIESVK